MSSYENQEFLDKYISDIQQHDLMSREEEAGIARHYQKNHDETSARQLILSNLRFVVKIANEYSGYGLSLLDLIQEGNTGLIAAARKFQPSKGYRLISYAIWWIRAYMQSFILKSWSLVKLGTTQAQRKLFFKLRSEKERLEKMFQQQQLSDITPLIAQRLDVAEKEVTAMHVRLNSKDLSLSSDVKHSSNQHYIDLLQDPLASNAETIYENKEEEYLLKRHVETIMQQFNEKERYIIKHRLMSDEPETLNKIGNYFGISRERARQIEGSVKHRMRHLLSDFVTHAAM